MNENGIGFPIFRMNDIKNAFLAEDELKYADIPDDLLAEYKLERDDILFNRVNAEEFVGRTGIVKLIDHFVFASYLIRLRTKKNGIIKPDYLNIFLNSSYGIKQIRKFRRRAVNQANVNAEELKQIRIPVLSLNIQEEISKLSNESWNQTEQSKSYYQQAENFLLEELGFKDFRVEDDLSFVVNLSDVKSAKRVDADYFQPKYQKLVEQIEKHNAKLLGNLVSMKKGFEPGSEAYQEEGKLFIRVSSLSKFGIEDKDQKYLSDDLYGKLKVNFEPKIGEILLTKDATPGIAYVLKEAVEGIISGGMMRLKVNNDIDPEYLALCISSLTGQMQAGRDAGGSIIAHWKPEQIKNLLIPVLPKPTQQKIAELVRKSHEARKKSKQLLEEAKRKVEEMIEEKSN
ncbi:restriction endonuclease subunit S [Candidatus Daviesbacteria bacterium]|nr:restriction endonuclease subunit S [Candidatus Daviesbacteria bacterium]